MSVEHRSEPREALALPVVFAVGGQGVTRDISASGLFFLTDVEQQMGSELALEIKLRASADPVKLVARGKVVRIEKQNHRMGVAVQLLNSYLKPGS